MVPCASIRYVRRYLSRLLINHHRPTTFAGPELLADIPVLADTSHSRLTSQESWFASHRITRELMS
jgi:hypothetical protein